MKRSLTAVIAGVGLLLASVGVMAATMGHDPVAMLSVAFASVSSLGSLDPGSFGMAFAAIGSVKLKTLREERGQLVHDARAILDKAEAEKRSLTADEDGKYKELFGKQEDLRSQIEREEQMVEAERSTAEQALRNKDAGNAGRKPGNPDEKRTGARGTPEYRDACVRFITLGRDALAPEELRALQSENDTLGGFLVMAEQMVDTLIKNVDDAVFIRQRATKFKVATAQGLGAPSLEADPADADWTAELATGNEDSTMAFGKRELHPRPLAKRIKVSNKLLRQSGMAEQLVLGRLAYKFGISQEKAFMTGNGANQPLGVFTASASGIPTTRDVSTGNLTTSPTFDGLISAKFGLKGQYWNKAEWLFHRDVLAVVAKLKDGDGQYLWRESVRAGEPDRILNLPVMMSEYAPNTLTTGLYVGLLGDFSNYWIADAVDLAVQRLTELYAETNQTGFIGRLECDGMPVLPEAFVRVKLG